MKKYLILILLVLLTGCSQSVNLGAESKLENKVETIKEKFDKASTVNAKYKLEKSAFIKEAKKDDEVRIELGDKTSDTFVPELMLGKWDEVSMKIKATENNLAKAKKAKNKKLGLLGASETELAIEDEKIIYSEDGMDYIFYDIEPNEEHPEGAYEFEIQLNEKPDTNYIEIEIETEGLDFFYQPEIEDSEIESDTKLTEEELLAKKREMQPENAVGSYAVYHSTKRDHIVGQTDYKTGKAMHIYYPYLIDSNGWKVRAENFVIGDGLMKITLPQTFLDTAVYPVLVDPTFGYTSEGASGRSFVINDEGAYYTRRIGNAYEVTEDGTLTKVSFYGKSTYSAVSVDTTLFVNKKDSVSTGSHGQIASGENLNQSYTTSYSLFDHTVSGSITDGSTYILSVLGNSAEAGNSEFLYIAYDTVSMDYYDEGAAGSSGYTTLKESPWTETPASSTRKFSIYATYTTGSTPVTTTEVKRQSEFLW